MLHKKGALSVRQSYFMECLLFNMNCSIPSGTLPFFLSSLTDFCLLFSLWSAVPWGGSHLRAIPQLLSQRRAVHLQRLGSSTHPDPLETSGVRQQGLLLCQPLSGFLFTQPCHPWPCAVLQVENSYCCLRWQHW